MTILIVLGIWFVGSVIFGLLAARFLRFSEANCLPEQVVGRSQDAVDDESDFFRPLIANSE